MPDLFEPGLDSGKVLVDQGRGHGRGGARRGVDHNGGELEVVGVDFNFYRFRGGWLSDWFGRR